LAYQHAVVTVLPSISQGEAFGLVLLESMSSGTPVIASDLPGVRSVVAHGQDGLLVPAKDAKSLAQALRVLMANPVARHRMGQAGRAKVEQSYSWTAIGLQWERLYREVMEA
jgi:glycosyltransferase involved in cell wall biosynthesis